MNHRIARTRPNRAAMSAAATVTLFSIGGGCGVNPSLTESQQEQDQRIKMAWIDKALDIAERHGLAYRVELESTGRPSVGQSLDFYLDSGLSARVCMFGNGAAGRPLPPTGPSVGPAGMGEHLFDDKVDRLLSPTDGITSVPSADPPGATTSAPGGDTLESTSDEPQP